MRAPLLCPVYCKELSDILKVWARLKLGTELYEGLTKYERWNSKHTKPSKQEMRKALCALRLLGLQSNRLKIKISWVLQEVYELENPRPEGQEYHASYSADIICITGGRTWTLCNQAGLPYRLLRPSAVDFVYNNAGFSLVNILPDIDKVGGQNERNFLIIQLVQLWLLKMRKPCLLPRCTKCGTLHKDDDPCLWMPHLSRYIQ